jgi:transposase
MKALVHHDEPDTLAQASRRSKSGRVAQRLWAIRDIMLGRSRGWVCAQYCVSGENLRHWVAWYNAHGRAGLEDAPRGGRPCKLTKTQRAALQARLGGPPELGKDGVGRWRAADVQQLIRREYGVEYRSITGVCHLLHRLGQAWLSGRPQHPQQAADAVAAFKKTPGHTPANRCRASRQDH